MFILNKWLKNERGLTLVEMLAVVVLITAISIFLFNIIIKAMENSENISIETELRDEADIIVSKFIKEMYSVHQKDIIYNVTNDSGSYLQITTDRTKCTKDVNGFVEKPTECASTLYPIGIQRDNSNGEYFFVYKNDTYKPSNKIKLESTSKIIGNPNDTSVYELIIDLKVAKKRNNEMYVKTMQFTNKVSPITK